jgi:hypothetical protein
VRRSNRPAPAAFAALALSLACLTLRVTPSALGPQVVATGTLVATVVDRLGAPIVDLDADDFVVEADGAAQPVLSAQIADYPIVLLADRGRSVEESESIRDSVLRFLKRVGAERTTAVGTLDAGTPLLVPFERSRAEALAVLEQPWLPQGGAQPLAAVANASRLLKEGAIPFGAVVLVWSVEEGRALLGESPETLSALFDMGASLHVVARRAAADAPQGAAEQFLRRLADRTAGRFTEIYTVGSYAAAVNAAADRFASEVMVQYLAGPADRGANLRVGVRIPGARVTGIRRLQGL